MQDRVVVLVHHPQLVGTQPVGLAQQPSPDRPYPDQRNRQRPNADRGDRRPLRSPAFRQGLLRDARRHQADDPAGAVAHRHDGADGRAECAGVHLGERLAAQRGLDAAEVVTADLLRIGVGEARSVRRHDRDERDVGVGAHRFGDGLQNLGGPSGFDRRGRRRRVGQRRRDGDDLLACGGVAVLAGVQQRQPAARQHHDRDHQDLQRDRLPGQRPRPPPGQDAPSSLAAMAKISSPAPTATK